MKLIALKIEDETSKKIIYLEENLNKLNILFNMNNKKVIQMYGLCQTYGKRLYLRGIRFRQGFIPLFVSKVLAKELYRNGLCN